MSKFLHHFWQNFKEYLILIFLIIISLYLITLDSSPKTQKIRAIVFGSLSIINSVISDVIEFENVKAENERLRATNADLMLQLSKLRKDALLIDELKNSLNLKDTSKFQLISSRVISRFSNSSQETVTINSGRKSGVEIGMPVINGKGLVGIIFSVSDDFAVVKTLRNNTLNLTVKSERTGEHGVLKWKSNSLRIINVPKTYQIKKGDRIVVSELSSIVPIVVPIGVANSLENIETGIFNEIVVLPFVDFNKVEYVFVVPVVSSKQIRDLELNLLKKFK